MFHIFSDKMWTISGRGGSAVQNSFYCWLKDQLKIEHCSVEPLGEYSSFFAVHKSLSFLEEVYQKLYLDWTGQKCSRLQTFSSERSLQWCFTHTRAHTHTHTWLGVCALTVPSRLPRAMSAYAERKAANRGEELRLNISSTQWNRVWLQSALTRDTPEAPIKSNLPNVSRLARCQTGQR